MKCVVIREHGDLDVLEMDERPMPEPKPGQVRIKVKAVALNHLDLWVRKGVPGHPFPLPIIPGCDIAGTVDLMGEGIDSTFKEGDDVLVAPGVSCGTCAACLAGQDHLCRHYGILGETQDGGCAEYAVVPAANLLPAPTNLPLEQAAGLPLVSLTAWHMLVHRAEVRAGEDVLVHAGGSGVSSQAIQMAKVFGCRVITTVGSDAKAERARELGADHVINYREQDFAKEVRALTGKRGVDVVIDHVGPDTWQGNIKSMAKGGRMVFCGSTSGFEVQTDTRFVFFKNLSILGSTMGSRGEHFEILRLVEKGLIRPVIDSVLPLEEIREAHRKMEAREIFGKMVMTP
ncbi:MAG: zinc-binding dehydrogenase [Planctomycetota bacterium]|jgi:NADPH:quinone reductase-like Zn-dependent oxidoreductase